MHLTSQTDTFPPGGVLTAENSRDHLKVDSKVFMNYSCIYLHHLWGLIQHNKLDEISLGEKEHWLGLQCSGR